MSQVNLKELEQNILRRLSAVDLVCAKIDRPAATIVLENYLDVLGLSARPIIWAKDGNHAQTLAMQSDPDSVEEELKAAIQRVFGDKVDRVQDGDWWRARDETRDAAHIRQLDIAKGVVVWHPVLLSVPWRLYRQRWTGDRGERNSPEHTLWPSVGDVLENAARARAECVYAHVKRAQKKYRQTFEQIWLPFVDAFESGLWFFWITAANVIALPRPAIRLMGDQLHAADGPAISWPESEEKYYFLNHVHVPGEIVETPTKELDPRLLLREQNVSVRREIVRKIGIERVCEELQTESLDRQGDYELLLLDLQDGRTRPFLKMRNPSLGVYHIEGVAPECRTVAEALAWRNQSDVPPSILT